MAKEFKGKIDLDIRDSTPDLDAFLHDNAPDGAPDVLAALLRGQRAAVLAVFVLIGSLRSWRSSSFGIFRISISSSPRGLDPVEQAVQGGLVRHLPSHHGLGWSHRLREVLRTTPRGRRSAGPLTPASGGR